MVNGRRSAMDGRWFLVLVIMILVLAVWMWRRRQPAPPGLVACDASLWQHVYHPQRLHVLDACRTVEGTIRSLREEADGDIHIRLDAGDRSLLNSTNLSRQHGDLVVEPMCMHAVTQADAMAACRDFTQNLAVPAVGDRVRVTGAYVTDLEHGWNEIHPVTSLKILR